MRKLRELHCICIPVQLGSTASTLWMLPSCSLKCFFLNCIFSVSTFLFLFFFFWVLDILLWFFFLTTWLLLFFSFVFPFYFFFPNMHSLVNIPAEVEDRWTVVLSFYFQIGLICGLGLHKKVSLVESSYQGTSSECCACLESSRSWALVLVPGSGLRFTSSSLRCCL